MKKPRVAQSKRVPYGRYATVGDVWEKMNYITKIYLVSQYNRHKPSRLPEVTLATLPFLKLTDLRASRSFALQTVYGNLRHGRFNRVFSKNIRTESQDHN